MIGSIGMTALNLLLLNPHEDSFETHLELCFNKIDKSSIAILKDELLYFKYILSNLSIVYQEEREGRLVPVKELNALANKYKAYRYSKPEEAEKLKEELEEKKKSFGGKIIESISSIQVINGKQVSLSPLCRDILQALHKRLEDGTHWKSIDRYLVAIEKFNVISPIGTVFRHKLYRLVNFSPAGLYYASCGIIADRRNPTESEIDEIINSAQEIKSRFRSDLNLSLDRGDYDQKDSIIDAYGVSVNGISFLDDPLFIDGAKRILEEKLSDTSNGNKYFSRIISMARDIYYMDRLPELYDKIFDQEVSRSKEEYEEAFDTLAKYGLPGLSFYNYNLFVDALNTLSLRIFGDISFDRAKFGPVIARILDFGVCAKTKTLEEI